ncbi:MAG TPA: corrinoid protein [Bellilinea sp.]|nr:corrinoid protein [Bellilinea sp.]
MKPELQILHDIIVDGNQKRSAELVQAALDAGCGPSEILNTALIPAMDKVGSLFEEGEYFVPEMLVAAKAMQNGLNILRPLLVAAKIESKGKVVIGTVQGDLHDIGKNLVTMMLEGSAFDVLDLGKDVKAQDFVDAVVKHDAQILALSALLTTTMVNMRTVIAAVEAAGLRDKVKIMVGGAPVTDRFAREIGADGYAPDASKAVALAKSLI